MQFIQNITDKALQAWEYCAHGVWNDSRNLWWVTVIKTLNITVKSFFDSDLQSRACAMTYRTLLAIVPALALIFAIGRGFGFQHLLQDELLKLFPAQNQAITHALKFVDSYLTQASEGIFVGIGILFLLWTLISLVSSVEESFDSIWNVKQGRSLWRQITDYTAMFLILPVLMICASGLSMLVSTTMQKWFDIEFVTPFLTVIFEAASWVFTWMFFTAVYILMPNAKVKFKYAMISGIITGTVFMILQWLFVSGQLYVAKYNAIYGSFSFLPLLLIWMQLAWVITLVGCLICYAAQNVFQYSFAEQVNNISPDYLREVTVAITAVIVQRFCASTPPVTEAEKTKTYGIPSRLVTDILDRLRRAGVISMVVVDVAKRQYGFQPAIPAETFTLADLRLRLQQIGFRDFIPDFDRNFSGVSEGYKHLNELQDSAESSILLRDMKINIPNNF